MTVYLSNRDGNGKTNEEGHYRLLSKILQGGVLTTNDLKVTQNSPLGMSVLVATGDYRLETSAGYSYMGWLTANEVVTVSTADPANPRVTSIVAYVDKAATTSASPPNNPGITKLLAVDGTPSATPSAPNSTVIQSAVGAGNPYMVLANVAVGAAATQITNANITDQRTVITMATDLVKSAGIADSNVITSKIADSAVTTPKIADQNVTTAKIADVNVTTGKLANNAVTAAKIETQEAWTTPALSNGWVVYDGTYNTPGYYKDSLGIVHLKGMIKSGTAALMFTLPVGYRPLRRYLIAASTNSNTYARLDIAANGQVLAGGAYSNSWFSLDNIHFRAEQ